MRRRIASNRTLPGWSMLCVLLAVLAAGCRTSPRPDASVRAAEGRSETGIEVEWWVVEAAPANGPRIREAIARSSKNPVRTAKGVLDVWRASGLRVLAVPEGEVGSFREAMGVASSIQRQRLGGVGQSVLAAVELSGGRVVQLDNGMLLVPRGRLELALRCHIAPDPTPPSTGEGVAAAIVVEITPRLTQVVPPTLMDGQATAPVVFDRLRMEGLIRKGEVLIVLPDSPTPALDEVVEPNAVPQIGPEVPPPPSLGEVLLGDSTGRRRTLAVLRGTIPDRFILIP